MAAMGIENRRTSKLTKVVEIHKILRNCINFHVILFKAKWPTWPRWRKGNLNCSVVFHVSQLFYDRDQ